MKICQSPSGSARPAACRPRKKVRGRCWSCRAGHELQHPIEESGRRDGFGSADIPRGCSGSRARGVVNTVKPGESFADLSLRDGYARAQSATIRLTQSRPAVRSRARSMRAPIGSSSASLRYNTREREVAQELEKIRAGRRDDAASARERRLLLMRPQRGARIPWVSTGRRERQTRQPQRGIETRGRGGIEPTRRRRGAEIGLAESEAMQQESRRSRGNRDITGRIGGINDRRRETNAA
jgi:hypothetical protein